MRLQLRFIILGCLLVAPLLAMTQSAQHPSLAETLRASRWQKRIVLLYAPTSDNAEFKQQKSLLAQEQGATRSRDIQVLELVATQLSAADKQYLQQQVKVDPAQFAVLLIGKDGGVKLRQKEALTTQELFGTIDKMPMRRQEMTKE
ncbi:DUF4174 domain-containing protein [Hymenobacter crusticola]|uniref:DUF4174 domain-containing protein n=1 Tax=Hymenobacter crusticola TaxID=1770526 RepID=A0A243WEV4_9BACT|nr:DUF4174 domain-containing protein [Hymenobacter crusticola]OUJ74226.1 hypothetical protein BXP70_10900 [Hymenobacter crusticola]